MVSSRMGDGTPTERETSFASTKKTLGVDRQGTYSEVEKRSICKNKKSAALVVYRMIVLLLLTVVTVGVTSRDNGRTWDTPASVVVEAGSNSGGEMDGVLGPTNITIYSDGNCTTSEGYCEWSGNCGEAGYTYSDVGEIWRATRRQESKLVGCNIRSSGTQVRRGLRRAVVECDVKHEFACFISSGSVYAQHTMRIDGTVDHYYNKKFTQGQFRSYQNTVRGGEVASAAIGCSGVDSYAYVKYGSDFDVDVGSTAEASLTC